MEFNKIYHMDCLDGMRELEDGLVDLIIADPPYSIGKAEWDKIDEYVDWCKQWILECQRVLKDNEIFYWFPDKPVWIAQLLETMRRDTELPTYGKILKGKFFRPTKTRVFKTKLG